MLDETIAVGWGNKNLDVPEENIMVAHSQVSKTV